MYLHMQYVKSICETRAHRDGDSARHCKTQYAPLASWCWSLQYLTGLKRTTVDVLFGPGPWHSATLQTLLGEETSDDLDGLP